MLHNPQGVERRVVNREKNLGVIPDMNEQINFAALREWFLTPQGCDVARACASELENAHLGNQGKYLLQLGDCGTNLWLDELNYRSKWLLHPNTLINKRHIIGNLNAMPFDRESIDCVIAPLTFEICGHEENPIDEIDRILKPLGHIIFFGINPWSWWGASLRWGRLSCFAHASAKFSSSLALKYAMTSRGYSQCWLSSFYYLPPIGSEFWLHKLEFLNQMSKMVWPYPAGFYCLILQKNDPCMTALPRTLRNDWHLVHMNST